MKIRIPLFAILLLAACTLYVSVTLVGRQYWYLSHNDFTRFETEEQVVKFLGEHLIIGQSTHEEVSAFLDILNLYDCISREDVDSRLTRFVIGCFVRAPKPDTSQIFPLHTRFFYEFNHWWYYLSFRIDNGILEEMYAFFEDSYV